MEDQSERATFYYISDKVKIYSEEEGCIVLKIKNGENIQGYEQSAQKALEFCGMQFTDKVLCNNGVYLYRLKRRQNDKI